MQTSTVKGNAAGKPRSNALHGNARIRSFSRSPLPDPEPSPTVPDLPDLARSVPPKQPRVSQGSFLLVSLFSILPSYRFGFDLFPKVYKFVPIQSFVLPGDNFGETGPLFTTLVSPSSCLAGACSFQNPSAEASSACKQCCCVTHMQFPAMLCNGRWQEKGGRASERRTERKAVLLQSREEGRGGWTKRLAAC